MTLDELLQEPCAWFIDHDPGEIAISSRIRLARNVEGVPFPLNAEPEALIRLRCHALQVLRENDHFRDGTFLELEDVTAEQRALLHERSLMSKELAEESRHGGLAVSKDLQDVVMVNEEDHLRLQVMRSGFSLQEVWKEISAVDEDLSAEVEFAFSDRFGYLTCCPTNTGTGLRAGVMLHLPGLVLMEEIRPVVKGLGKMGLAVRGLGGEGSDADGFYYQISNQLTLGQSEDTIVEMIHEVVEELIRHEGNARIRLEESKPAWLRDRVARAMGILQHARILPSKEALDLLSMARLGLALGLLKMERAHEIEQLMVDSRPAHLQKIAGKALSPGDRDIFRAEWVRSKLADLMKGPTL